MATRTKTGGTQGEPLPGLLAIIRLQRILSLHIPAINAATSPVPDALNGMALRVWFDPPYKLAHDYYPTASGWRFTLGASEGPSEMRIDFKEPVELVAVRVASDVVAETLLRAQIGVTPSVDDSIYWESAAFIASASRGEVTDSAVVVADASEFIKALPRYAITFDVEPEQAKPQQEAELSLETAHDRTSLTIQTQSLEQTTRRPLRLGLIVAIVVLGLFLFGSCSTGLWRMGIDGHGYRVTCDDGTTSLSGGEQGACSHHGGVG